jgi:hypothetical protein
VIGVLPPVGENRCEAGAAGRPRLPTPGSIIPLWLHFIGAMIRTRSASIWVSVFRFRSDGA